MELAALRVGLGYCRGCRINRRSTVVGWRLACSWGSILALSGCGASPAMVDTVNETSPNVVQAPLIGDAEASEVQSATNDSGPGNIVYDQRTRAKCKRRRVTGANFRRSDCSTNSGLQTGRFGPSNGSGAAARDLFSFRQCKRQS